MLAVAAFLAISLRERTVLNVVFPHWAVLFGTCYFFPSVALIYELHAISPTLEIVFIFQTILAIGFAFGYVTTNTKGFSCTIQQPENYSYKLPLILLTLSLVVYSPLIAENFDVLLQPRRIYEATRTAAGHFFYISTALVFLGLTITLLSKANRFVILLSIVFSMIIAFLHGSKGQLITVLEIIFIFYASKSRLPSTIVAQAFVIVAFSLLSVFSYYLISDIPVEYLIKGMVSYSDYVFNAEVVIDNNYPTQYGRTFFEDNIYAFIPRIIFESKPDNFGTLGLSQYFFPNQFNLGQGAASVGIANYYIDFGYATPLILLIASFFLGKGACRWKSKFSVTNNAGDFLVLLGFLGITFLPVGVGLPLIQMLILSIPFYWCSKRIHEKL